jgi:hypothetical protein
LIVEALNVLQDLGLGLLPIFVNLLFDFSLFKLLKNYSATALSQQLPVRLILGLKWLLSPTAELITANLGVFMLLTADSI